MIKRAILTGEQHDLQAFIYEWYEDEKDKEVPIIEPDMDVILQVAEKHERPLRSMAYAFNLNCAFVETEK